MGRARYIKDFDPSDPEQAAEFDEKRRKSYALYKRRQAAGGKLPQGRPPLALEQRRFPFAFTMPTRVIEATREAAHKAGVKSISQFIEMVLCEYIAGQKEKEELDKTAAPASHIPKVNPTPKYDPPIGLRRKKGYKEPF